MVEMGRQFSRIMDGFSYLRSIPNMAANFISMFYRVHGHSATICTLNCSSLQALAYAAELIDRDEADVVITGGGDSWLHACGLVNYAGLEPPGSSEDESRHAPFSVHCRKYWTVPGEGAACMILESHDSAARRKAPFYAYVKGSYSAYSSAAGADAMVQAVRGSIEESGLLPVHIDAIVTHGSWNPVLERVEADGLSTALHERGSLSAAYSITPFCGNAVAGSGALQTLAASLSLKNGVLFNTPSRTASSSGGCINTIAEAGRSELRHMLISSVNYDSSATALVLERGETPNGSQT
jgi:3-oxoacyl-[acyl-carrier-protein] synthase II